MTFGKKVMYFAANLFILKSRSGVDVSGNKRVVPLEIEWLGGAFASIAQIDFPLVS